MSCLLCNKKSLPLHYGFHVSTYGARVHEYFLRIFCNSWMDLQRCFSYCSLPILLCNGQTIAEYEAYWLMGLPIINLWGARFMSIFSVFFVMAGWIAEILFMLFFACVTNATKLSTKQIGLSVLR